MQQIPKTPKQKEADALLGDLTRKLISHGMVRTCLNCEFFDKDKEGCQLFDGARPPAHIIASGCDEWDQEIPF